MILKRIRVKVLEEHETNCYIVMDEKTNETIVVDPGGDVDKIIEMLDAIGAKLKYIYLTHCHADHSFCVNELRQKKGGIVLIHRDGVNGLIDDKINLATYIGLPELKLKDVSRVDDGDKIHIGSNQFIVIHTPGHTQCGSCLYCKEEKFVFTGDTMFRGTWGRTDLPTGSMVKIIDSIMNKLLKLPDDTIVYSGHGKSTMIREERPIYEDLKPRID